MEPPAAWTDPAPMSTLEALLIFVGIPLGLSVVIALLVMAPSVAKGPRYRPGLAWWAEPEWFGAPPEHGRDGRPALEPGTQPADAVAAAPSGDTADRGGASACW